MNNRYFILLFLFIAGNGFGECSSGTNPNSEDEMPYETDTPPIENSDTEIPEEDSVETEDPNALPQISLPAPSLRQEYIVAYAADTSLNVPVVAKANTISSEYTNGDYTVNITTEDSVDTTTTCPIESDGSFVCYVPNTTNDTTLSISVSNTDGTNKSITYTEKPNMNLLWFANSPTDLKIVGDRITSITLKDDANTNIGLALKADKTGIAVDGNFEHSYAYFHPYGSKLSYDVENNLVADVNENNGIFIRSLDPYDFITDTGFFSHLPPAGRYSVVKYDNNKTYCGIAQQESSNSAALYWALEDSVYDTTDEDHSIPFIIEGDPASMDINGNQLTHLITLAFAYDDDGFAYILYRDANNLFRMRLSNGKIMKGGAAPLPLKGENRVDLRDLQLTEIEGSFSKNILLVDAGNDIIWFLNQHFKQGVDSLVNSIAVGHKPIAMVFNEDKSRAYILNQEDESISVLAISKTISDVPKVVATVTLADFAQGKDISFVPTTLLYADGRLLVGSEEIKGAVVIDTSEIIEQ